MMAQLRSCSFNCRGWNSGVRTLKNFINSLDVCFVQEHWLLNDQLHKIHEISPDFLSVGVSGMDNSEFLLGRPFGGCTILYLKCLASCISSLETCSNRFCAVKFCDSTGITSLLISIYMPAVSGPSSYTEYLNTLGELEGCNHCDNVFVVGDLMLIFIVPVLIPNCGVSLCLILVWFLVIFHSVMRSSLLMSVMMVSVVLGSTIFYALSLLVL